MRLSILEICPLAITLISWGCGSNANPARVGSSNEMMRVQSAFAELQQESESGSSKQEFTLQVNNALARIGDLKTSEKAAGLGLPEDKVALVYDYFRQAAIAYAISTEFVGAGWDASSNKTTDSTSDGERESITAAFPAMDAVDMMSRRKTLYDLLRIAQNETRDAEGMIKTL